MNETIERIQAYIEQALKHYDHEDRMRIYDELREWTTGEYEHELVMSNFTNHEDE